MLYSFFVRATSGEILVGLYCFILKLLNKMFH